MIGRDRLRDVLKDDRLAGAGRSDDQGALTLAYRGNNIDYAGLKVIPCRIVNFQLEPLIRI